MNKNELVKSLISNAATAWSEQDEEYLMGLDEDKLQKMVPIVNDEDEPSVEEPPVEEPPAEELPAEEPPVETPPATEPQVNMKKARKPVTVNEYLNDPNIPQEIRDVLHEGMASRSADRTRLINVITANERNVFSREQLDKKPSEELRALAKLAAPEEQPHSNYLGQADPMTMNDAGDVEPLPVPNWND